MSYCFINEENDPPCMVNERLGTSNVSNDDGFMPKEWYKTIYWWWSMRMFYGLFTGVEIVTEHTRCEIIDVDYSGRTMLKCTIEKATHIYDWLIKLKCRCFINNTIMTGNINIEFCQGEIEDEHFDVTFDASGCNVDVVKHVLQTTGKEIIQKKLSMYVSALEKGDFTLPVGQEYVIKTVDTEDLCYVEMFNCTAKDFYNITTSEGILKSVTLDRYIRLNDCLGGEFGIWEHVIEGFFTELKPYERIGMKWTSTQYPVEHYCDYVLTIKEKMNSTEVKHEIFAVPKDKVKETRELWAFLLWDNIRRFLEINAKLGLQEL